MEGSNLVPGKTNANNSPNPSYKTWYKIDQALLGIIVSSISPNIVASMYGSRTFSTYLEGAKFIADQLAAAGKSIDDQDLISFILGGLNQEFNPFITSFNFASRDKDFCFEDFNVELLSHEALLDTQRSAVVPNTTFAFAASKKSSFPPKKKPLVSAARQSNSQQGHSLG
ncbi:uncharacterized protein LOC122274422 [Carya illinoinensis]|uniref:uncharacterized protein LOC122274422 n=1 Tax=Carya illinoinensis TaxID=32201 RepID=UPI001C724685|nr:uncharacterized protein LOC122274422 [Carya illinoinensis]